MSTCVGIPACFLVVFEHEVFVAVAIVIYNIGVGVLGDGAHIFDHSRAIQFGRLQPSAQVSLVGCIGAGHAGIVVVHAAVHNAPFGHTEVAARRVVEVGQTEAVGILVAECADASELGAAVAIEFVAAGVLVEILTARIEAFAVGRILQVELVRPNG